MKKHFFCLLSIAIVGVLAFFAGLMLGKNQASQTAQPDFGSFANSQQLHDPSVRFNQPGGQANSAVISGEIISKDESNLTIKLLEGGSQIIYISGSTFFNKTLESSLSDFSVGEQISVIGQTNDDGSVVAQSVQTRPNSKRAE